MDINLAKYDRLARIVLGILLMALVFVGPKTPWGYIGLIPLLTGLAGFCPIYGMFNVSSRHHYHR
jgi:hypothetical protein